MSTFPPPLPGPLVVCETFIRAFNVTTELDQLYTLPDSLYTRILEEIDCTAIGGAPTPVHFSAQMLGCFFWTNSQDIGAGEQVYASWRGYMLIEEGFDIAIQSSIAASLNITARGRTIFGLSHGDT